MRVQLSLFVPDPAGDSIEAVRGVVDPVQSRLIPAHVTLCREDELDGFSTEALALRVATWTGGAVVLRLGPPERFHEHGILMPCLDGESPFQQLRMHLLHPRPARVHPPHLTLAHPRNLRAVGNTLANTEGLRDGLTIAFSEVRLIEQRDATPWVVLQSFALHGC